MMMLFQLGLYDALFRQVVRPLEAMRGDLILLSKTYTALADAGTFPRRRLHQVMGDADVEDVASVFVSHVSWRNPQTGERREIFLLGCRPGEAAFGFEELNRGENILKEPDGAFFDRLSRPEYGPIVSDFERKGLVETETQGLRMRVQGLFEMGTTFAADGNLLVGESAFLRIAPHYPKDMISVGLIRLKPGHDSKLVMERLRAVLPADVRVLAKHEFFKVEREYWATRTPIGFVISASMLVAFIVGAVVLYQILYADVSDHIHEYATLKGIGFTDGFFLRLILQQSLILSGCGFVPGVALAAVLFKATRAMAGLPTELDATRTVLVLFLTTAMCAVGGILAAQKLKQTSPADLF
jgi:putative ABC transport system permease protein